jgi:hypothetical protein
MRKLFFAAVASAAVLTACVGGGKDDENDERQPSIMDGYYEGIISIDSSTEYPFLIILSDKVFTAAYTPSNKLGHIPDHVNCQSNFVYKSPDITVSNSGLIYNFAGNYDDDPETEYKMVDCNDISKFIPLEYIYSGATEEITSKPNSGLGSAHVKKVSYNNLSTKSRALLKSFDFYGTAVVP